MAKKRNHKLPFEDAKDQYIGRYTLEHIPSWARRPLDRTKLVVTRPEGQGDWYAPQYRTDREWYDNTVFPGDPGYDLPPRFGAQSSGQTWPMGLWLHRCIIEIPRAERDAAKAVRS